jgi:hypothetical protein
MNALFSDVRAPRDGDVSDMCGGVTNPEGELSAGCSAALQAHAQSAILPAIAGVGWMLGAVAFGLGDNRRTDGVPTGYPAPAAGSVPPGRATGTASPQAWHDPGVAWPPPPHGRTP